MKCLRCGSEQDYITSTYSQFCLDCRGKNYKEQKQLDNMNKAASISPVNVALMRIDALASLLNISSLSIDTELKRLYPAIYKTVEEEAIGIFNSIKEKEGNDD